MSLASTAGFAIGTETPSGADAAKSSACLSGPKGAAPQGERWYYRVDRTTRKNCWYTRAGTSKNVAARTPARKPGPEPIEAADDTPSAPLQPAIANARAEATPSAFPPPSAAMPSAVVPSVTSPSVPVDNSPSRPPVDRFSEHPNAGLPVQALPATIAQPTPPAEALPVAATGASTSQFPSLGLLLVLIGGALALVAGVVALISRFSRPRIEEAQNDHWQDNDWPEARWDADQAESSPPLSVADDDAPAKEDAPPMNWVRIAREHADRHDDEIEQLLSRKAQA